MTLVRTHDHILGTNAGLDYDKTLTVPSANSGYATGARMVLTSFIIAFLVFCLNLVTPVQVCI